MTTLMVTPFAPYRDGIASYAAQELRHLRSQGHAVEVVSSLPSAAHHHLPLGGVRGASMLAKRGAGYERVIVQFGPEMLFGGCRGAAERVAVWMALAGLARATRLELRIHEIEYRPLEQNPAERRAAGLAVRWADRVTVHTAPERRRLAAGLGGGKAGSTGDRIELLDHGHHFVPAVSGSAAEAKSELGLAADEFAFLAIGFLQHHKGFDRAVEAFALADLPRARLHVVGSGRVDHPEIGRYVGQLARMCNSTPAVELHNRFVSDDQFDLWLLAADAVVLPYREIWSSGVVERARLFDKTIIASDLDQLRHQLGEGGLTCSDVGDFAVAMEKVWSSSGLRPPPDEDSAERATAGGVGRRRPMSPVWDVDEDSPDVDSIQAQIEQRAREQERGRYGADGEGNVGDPMTWRSTPAGSSGGQASGPGPGHCQSTGSRPSHALHSLGPLQQPEPVSARPGVTPVKQTVQRLTAWQLEPFGRRIADLQQATIDAVVQMEARLDRLAESVDEHG